MKKLQLTPFEKLQTRQAVDRDTERRRGLARYDYDEVRIGRERERQLIAEAERMAEKSRRFVPKTEQGSEL